MTGRADFTEEEWQLLCEGPAAAGMVALTASTGGSFRESWALAKSYAEAREQHGESELLDALVAEEPSVKEYESPEELEQHGLRRLSEAVLLLEAKATRGEVHGYKHFTLDVAANVAEAHKEEIAGVTPEERAAIEKIAASLNPPPESSDR
jgi:hypothetical protein